ncbi:hypothetical protein [Anaerosacchariphilus polymeriproducens]|uniref:hypothetical protein n=1 Tax=Anaerosacchariphilus polymeriproducens TaxID=1812858 RepID=UPI0012D730D6|nr:hypothetical protein [Anaerosacchariphilus polymeriproducens]
MYDIKIEFTDGTEKIVENVEDCELNFKTRCFSIEKGDDRYFVPCENVKYIGKI